MCQLLRQDGTMCFNYHYHIHIVLDGLSPIAGLVITVRDCRDGAMAAVRGSTGLFLSGAQQLETRLRQDLSWRRLKPMVHTPPSLRSFPSLVPYIFFRCMTFVRFLNLTLIQSNLQRANLRESFVLNFTAGP